MLEQRFTLGQLINQLEGLGLTAEAPVMIREYDDQNDEERDLPLQSIHVTITPGATGEVILSALTPRAPS